MAVGTVTPSELHERHRRWEHTTLTTELLLAVGAVVLSTIGLVRALSTYLAAVGTIGLGVMFLFKNAPVILE